MKYSLFLLILVFVVLGVIALGTDALPIIGQANPLFFGVAALFFVFSIVFWVIPWALLLKKKGRFGFLSALVLGFSCVYGALTPLQLGSEALRAIKAKEHFGVNYSDSIAAAMIVKGMKFFFLALMACVVIAVILLQAQLSGVMFIGLLSGFVVIVLAALLFLLPLNKNIGLKIAGTFKFLSKFIRHFAVLERYFTKYSNYLESTKRKTLFIVLLMSALSFALEFLALLFCFFALNVFIDLLPLAVLFVIICILERTPFLPRGLGLVEAAGFIFLSLPEFSMISIAASQVGAILILFDVTRLIIPTIISLTLSFIKVKKTC